MSQYCLVFVFDFFNSDVKNDDVIILVSSVSLLQDKGLSLFLT